MRGPAILVGFLALAACTAPAVISDINDGAVRIEVSSLTSPAEIDQRARTGCGVYGREPVLINYRCLDGHCDRKELLFACKAPSSGGAVSAPAAIGTAGSASHGAYDGKWVAEGFNDGCGWPWAMEISVRNGEAKGLLWRGRAEYNFQGRLDSEGKLEKALAAKTPASNGLVGPRFITVNAAFDGETAKADYSMAAPGVTTCIVSVNLVRHQA